MPPIAAPQPGLRSAWNKKRKGQLEIDLRPRTKHGALRKKLAFRYHATTLASPTQVRNAVSYVINNWRHHRCDRHDTRRTDPFASAHAIREWRIEPHPDQLPVVRPTTWLLTTGYRLAPPITADEIPGPDPTP